VESGREWMQKVIAMPAYVVLGNFTDEGIRNTPDHVATYGRMKKEEVDLEGVTMRRVTFGVGATWSTDLKPPAGTESCLLPHVAYVQSGRLRIRTDDGAEEEFGPDDIVMLPPGHDTQTVGEEPCVFIEFSRGADYYAS
jgi:hypothetical protein